MRFKFKWILTLIVALLFQLSFAQEKTITGVVSDIIGPLTGANVVIKGTNKGTTTDFNGGYSIKASIGDVLVFSYVGTKDTIIIVAEANNYDVLLKAEELSEVVVTGALGVKRKQENITYANEVLNSKQVNQAANSNAIQALAGKVSGLQINTTGSGVDPNKDIILRGYGSITGDNSALIVIDDVISTTGTLNSIDPNSIESINVLKGPVGGALYGSVGSNGVIIVTTKKGSIGGKLNVDFKLTKSFESIAFLPERQDRFGQGYQGDWDWTDQGSWGPEFDGSTQVTGSPYPTASDWRYDTYEHIEDHIKPFFNTGIEDQYTLSLSGGDAKEGYANLTLNNVSTEGLIPGDKRIKNFFSLNTGKKVGKVMFKGVARYTTTKTNIANGNSYFDLSQSASNIDITKYASGDNRDNWTLYADSPYWNLKNRRTETNTNRFEGILDFSYELNKNINFVARSGVNFFSTDLLGYVNEYEETDPFILNLFDTSISSTYLSRGEYNRRLYTDILANFNYALTDNLSFNGLLGYNQTENKFRSRSITGSGFTIPGLYTVGNLELVDDPTETFNKRRTQSVMASAEFGYKNFATLLLTGRNDWLSNISKQNRSAFYPSASLSFTPTNMFPSIKGKALNNAKIYGGWTQIDKGDSVDEYEINQRAFNPDGFPFSNSGNSFISVSNLTNANIVPEEVNTFEIGGNFDFLKVNGTSRINLDFAYSNQTNSNQILGTTPSSSSGLVAATINVGKTTTNTYEIDLGFTPVKTENFEWNTRIGYSTYKTIVNKITDLSDQITVRDYDNGNPSGTVGITAIEGEQWPLITGTAYTRDDLGRIVIDANGNPVRSNEQKILGKVAPDYLLNFNTTIRYKGFTLGATLDYRTGHQFYSGIANNFAFIGASIESAANGREAFLLPNSTVQGSGETNTTVLTGGNTAASFQNYFADTYRSIDENFIIDATALKIREVALSYDFNEQDLKNIGLTKLNIGIAGRNLYTFLPRANRQYNDPEFGTGLSNYSTTPPTRSFALSINVAF